MPVGRRDINVAGCQSIAVGGKCDGESGMALQEAGQETVAFGSRMHDDQDARGQRRRQQFDNTRERLERPGRAPNDDKIVQRHARPGIHCMFRSGATVSTILRRARAYAFTVPVLRRSKTWLLAGSNESGV